MDQDVQPDKADNEHFHQSESPVQEKHHSSDEEDASH